MEAAEQATEREPLLRVEGLHVGYSDVDIVRGASIQVGPGDLVAIIGPNGAGKSTLLKAVFGLLRPRAGRIVFAGEDITGLRPDLVARKGLGYVPQVANVFPTLTVRENLELGAYLHRGATQERMATVVERFPRLGERMRQKAQTLSGGERQMLAMGKVLMGDPRMLLLDEPSAGLAPAIVDDILQRVREVNEAGIAVLMVEQNARKALARAHRGYVLESGKNRFEGPGPELLANPEVGRLYLGARAPAPAADGEGEATPP